MRPLHPLPVFARYPLRGHALPCHARVVVQDGWQRPDSAPSTPHSSTRRKQTNRTKTGFNRDFDRSRQALYRGSTLRVVVTQVALHCTLDTLVAEDSSDVRKLRCVCRGAMRCSCVNKASSSSRVESSATNMLILPDERKLTGRGHGDKGAEQVKEPVELEKKTDLAQTAASV